MSFQYLTAILLSAILFTQIRGQCDDLLPPLAPFDCQNYLDLGICASLTDEFCRSSCGRCGCDDVPVPGTTCADIVASGICDADEVRGIYCQKSCGACAPFSSQQNNTISTQGDCEALDAIECDIEGLKAFLPSSIDFIDPCSDISGITCENKRVTNISIGGFTNILEFYDGYTDITVDTTLSAVDLWGQSIPAEMSKLRYLQRFEVEGTDLGGTIPPEISTLAQMQIFDIDGDRITGTLPVELSTWTKIKWFDASYCQFTGTLPASYSEWKDVVVIDFSEGPRLSGVLPGEWSTMDKLEHFYLYDAGQYTGSVPAQWSTLEDTLLKLIFGTQDSLCIDQDQQIDLVAAFRDKERNNPPIPPYTDARDLITC